jgi:hypothetical protein
MLTRAQDRELRTAFTRFDRLTAYGCAQRGHSFDREAMVAAWRDWLKISGFPMPPGYHYGDSRDVVNLVR